MWKLIMADTKETIRRDMTKKEEDQYPIYVSMRKNWEKWTVLRFLSKEQGAKTAPKETKPMASKKKKKDEDSYSSETESEVPIKKPWKTSWKPWGR